MIDKRTNAIGPSSFRRASAPRLAWSFFRIGAMNELQYRSNFFIQLLQSVLEVGAGLVGLAVVFGRTTSLSGWTRPELLVVMGVFTMVGGITNTFVVPNMQKLVEDIQRGTLDFALTKPADAQTLVSVRQVSIWQSVDILAGLIVLIVALVQLGDSSDGFRRASSLVMLLLLGNWTIYCFWLILASSAFWFIRVGEMQELFQGLFRSGQYPVRIYPRWMRFGLTFLVPIGFAVTVPAEAATNRLTGTTIIVALVAAAVFGIASRWIWRTGLRHYSGASA
ncbi:MAG: ABC-2 family transporter protein [Actinomycetota bacterium]